MAINSWMEQDERRPGSAPAFLSKEFSVDEGRTPSVSKTRRNFEEAKSWNESNNLTSFSSSKRSKGKDDDFNSKSEEKMTARNFLGVISKNAFEEYVNYSIERKAGRDRNCGFRTPFGEDYKAVGGDVSTVPGDTIKRTLLPEGFIPRVKGAPPTKVPLSLDVSVEQISKTFKFTYYEIDLTERPLHSNPSRTLNIQWSASEDKDVEIYFSMSENHPYPEKSACDWEPEPEAHELIVYPTDLKYKGAKEKKLTIAIRGTMGYLEYKLKAETKVFLSKLEKFFKERASVKAEEDKDRTLDRKDIQKALLDSQMRTVRAKNGLKTPEMGFRPILKKEGPGSPLKEQSVATEEREVEDGKVDLDDLDDIPLRADHVYALKNQPLSQFLKTVLSNIEMEVTRQDRYRGATSPYCLRLDKLAVAKPAAVVDAHQPQASQRASSRAAIGGKVGGPLASARAHDMPLPSARGRPMDALASARAIAREHADGSRPGGAPLPSSRIAFSQGAGGGMPAPSARGMAPSAREPPGVMRGKSDSARSEATEDVGVTDRTSETSARSSVSGTSNQGSLLKGVHRDEARLYTSIFRAYRKDCFITQQVKDERGKVTVITVKEVGVNVPRLHDLLKDMKIVGNTTLEKVPSKRDINTMCREIFRARGSDRNPSEENIVLTEEELRGALEQLGKDFFDKAIYLVGSKPEGVEKKVWERLRDEANPTKRLQKIASRPDFKRKILRAFGRWDRDSDGRLGKEEFILLCAKEIGLQREDSLTLLRRAGVHRRDAVRLNTFVNIFFPPDDDQGAVDERDTAAAREGKLAQHLLSLHLRELTSTVSVDELRHARENISALQDKMLVADGKSADVVKQGWLECRDPKSLIANWRKCFCTVERHAGGGVLRIHTFEVKPEQVGLPGKEPVETLFLDGRNPVNVPGAKLRVQVEEEREDMGDEESDVPVEPEEDTKRPCVFKMLCKHNLLAAPKPPEPKRRSPKRREPQAGNLSHRSTGSLAASEDGGEDGLASARSGCSSARSACFSARSRAESARSARSAVSGRSGVSMAPSQANAQDPGPDPNAWHQSAAENSNSAVFAVQFRICGHGSLAKAEEWAEAVRSAVNSLELQTNSVLLELGSLLRNAGKEKCSTMFQTVPESLPERSAALAAEEDRVVDAVRDGLRALLNTSSIITPAYDGAGMITLQGRDGKDDGNDRLGAEGWDETGGKGKGGRGRAVRRLPTIVEEQPTETVWDDKAES